MEWIEIDGSQGEGGGQILRSALSLSVITGKPFEIFNIRARRANPGLQPQHLASVRAAAMISSAEVEGAERGSQRLRFIPHQLTPGDYRLSIQTAGSTSLVLHTLAVPLALTWGVSTVHVAGGTHVPWSPNHHYMELQWVPFMRRIGISVELKLIRAGFYPQGGGLIEARIHPTQEIHPLKLEQRGALQKVVGVSLIANLDWIVGERQRWQAEERLQERALPCEIRTERMPAKGRNTVMQLMAQFEHTQCCYASLGALGKRAEKVADEACDALLACLDTQATVDEHLADQLLLPLALADGESVYLTPRITGHIRTSMEIIRTFLPAKLELEELEGGEGRIRIEGAGLQGLSRSGPK